MDLKKNASEIFSSAQLEILYQIPILKKKMILTK